MGLLYLYSVTSQVPGQRDETPKLNTDNMIMFCLARSIIAYLGDAGRLVRINGGMVIIWVKKNRNKLERNLFQRHFIHHEHHVKLYLD
jgi:hypothetical protein